MKKINVAIGGLGFGAKIIPLWQKLSANWTCVGLCAHESALKGGASVKLPAFTR